MASKTQKAIQAVAKGKAELRTDVVVPEPADGQVLIQVHAVGLNPVDQALINYNFAGNAFPFTLGYDVAGVVVKVGKDVHQFKVGDAVFGHTLLTAHGSYAEYVATTPDRLAKKPANVSFEQVAAIPVAFLSAYHGLKQDNIKAGETVYIPGGSGGVGHFAIQIAHILGAKVISSGGRPESIKFLEQELKVEKAFNYKDTDPTVAVKAFTNGKGADVIYDCVTKPADIHVTLESLAEGGRFNALGKPDLEKTKAKDVLTSKKGTYLPCDLGSYSFHLKGEAKDFIAPSLALAAEWLSTGKLQSKINATLNGFDELLAFVQANKPVNGKAVAVLHK